MSPLAGFTTGIIYPAASVSLCVLTATQLQSASVTFAKMAGDVVRWGGGGGRDRGKGEGAEETVSTELRTTPKQENDNGLFSTFVYDNVSYCNA